MFADLLRKHGIPVDLKDALRKSAVLTKPEKSGPEERQIMTSDPDPFEEGCSAPRARTFRRQAIRIGTAARNTRRGPRATRE